MDDSEKSKGTWWQTVPGILTALAGIVTAVGGLLVTLHQVGLIGSKDKPVLPSTSSANDGNKPANQTAPAATPAKDVAAGAALPSDTTKPAVEERAMAYSVGFPNGTEVTLRSRSADGTYKILAAQVDSGATGKLTLTLSVRLTNAGRSDLGFWSDSFRLLIDGVPRAPMNFLNTLVEARSAKEGRVVFEVPDSAENLVLSVKGDGEDTANLPLVLAKSH